MDDEEKDNVPKIPPHLTHSFIRSLEAWRATAPATAMPSTSRCDSTRLSPHSPGLVEILPRKSPAEDLERITSFLQDDADNPGDGDTLGLLQVSAYAASLRPMAGEVEEGHEGNGEGDGDGTLLEAGGEVEAGGGMWIRMAQRR